MESDFRKKEIFESWTDVTNQSCYSMFERRKRAYDISFRHGGLREIKLYCIPNIVITITAFSILSYLYHSLFIKMKYKKVLQAVTAASTRLEIEIF